jgi:hypothetical protein
MNAKLAIERRSAGFLDKENCTDLYLNFFITLYLSSALHGSTTTAGANFLRSIQFVALHHEDLAPGLEFPRSGLCAASLHPTLSAGH